MELVSILYRLYQFYQFWCSISKIEQISFLFTERSTIQCLTIIVLCDAEPLDYVYYTLNGWFDVKISWDETFLLKIFENILCFYFLFIIKQLALAGWWVFCKRADRKKWREISSIAVIKTASSIGRETDGNRNIYIRKERNPINKHPFFWHCPNEGDCLVSIPGPLALSKWGGEPV